MVCNLCEEKTEDQNCMFPLPEGSWLVWGGYGIIDCQYYLFNQKHLPPGLLVWPSEPSKQLGKQVCDKCVKTAILPFAIHLGEYGVMGSDCALPWEKIDNFILEAIRLHNERVEEMEEKSGWGAAFCRVACRPIFKKKFISRSYPQPTIVVEEKKMSDEDCVRNFMFALQCSEAMINREISNKDLYLVANLPFMLPLRYPEKYHSK